MGEEVLVLRGEDRTPNDGRDVLIPGDLTVFGSDLNERPVGDIVDVANRGKVKPIEGLHVGQVRSAKIDVVDSTCNQSGPNDRSANKNANGATPPR
ncbi:MAG: hypothetical protein ABSH56_31390 [Bryobacteraceae bacterium]